MTIWSNLKGYYGPTYSGSSHSFSGGRLTNTENCLNGSILILGMTQDIYFLSELEFAVNLLCFDEFFRVIYHKKRENTTF